MSSKSQKLQQMIEKADEVFKNVQDGKNSKTIYESALKLANELDKKPKTEYIL